MKKLLLLLLALLAASVASVQGQFAPRNFALQSDRGLDAAEPELRLTSNVIIDVLPTSSPDVLWLGTGSGVTRAQMINIPGMHRPNVLFANYSVDQGLGKGGVSALVVTDTIIWAAFAFDTSVGISGAGGGLAYSRDGGATWTWLPQPRDPYYRLTSTGYDEVLGYWPTATNVDNITYGIAFSDSFVWTVSKGGGLRRHAFAADYTDYNDTSGWKVVTPDNLPFHPFENLNHRAFSVLYAENALWVGTAAGINKSTDNGRTWTRYSSGTANISGNFITALDYQAATHTVWAATWRAEGENDFYAVSKTSDGGRAWTVCLTEEQIRRATGMAGITPRAHAFAFDDTLVYVCDDLGLWKSPDGGTTWDLFFRIEDVETGRRFYEPPVYSALKINGRLWAGGVDGLAMSQNDGREWYLFQTARSLGDPSRTKDTYAYPTPWSPARFGPVKLRYATHGGAVKVTIYDFAMSKVAELPCLSRGPGEQYEVWDGRRSGTIVANGTYFYKIDRPEGTVWGKLIVLD